MRCKNITNKLCSGEFSNDRELPYYKRAPRKWFTVSRLKHSVSNQINPFCEFAIRKQWGNAKLLALLHWWVTYARDLNCTAGIRSRLLRGSAAGRESNPETLAPKQARGAALCNINQPLH